MNSSAGSGSGRERSLANLRPFVKGQSGNPSGMPKVIGEVQALARVDCPEAYRVVVELMREASKDSVRLAAAVKVLQIAGVPMNAEALTVNVTPERPRLDGVSTDDLLRRASTSLSQ